MKNCLLLRGSNYHLPALSLPFAFAAPVVLRRGNRLFLIRRPTDKKFENVSQITNGLHIKYICAGYYLHCKDCVMQNWLCTVCHWAVIREYFRILLSFICTLILMVRWASSCCYLPKQCKFRGPKWHCFVQNYYFYFRSIKSIHSLYWQFILFHYNLNCSNVKFLSFIIYL